MDRMSSPIPSLTESIREQPCANDHSSPAAPDSLQMQDQIETLSFHIFSWLSAHSKKDKRRIIDARRHSTPQAGIYADGTSSANIRRAPPFPTINALGGSPIQNVTLTRPRSTSVTAEDLYQLIFSENTRIECADLERLKETGYSDLAQKLQNRKGYPWNEICQLPNPVLMEQLLDIYEMLGMKRGFDEATQEGRLFKFTLELAKDKLINNTQTLGELICLINSSPKDVLESISVNDVKRSQVWIHQQFVNILRDINTRVIALNSLHGTTGIQNGDIVARNRLPIEFAQILVSETGRINVGIISYLLGKFLQNNDRPINYEINLAYAMRMLEISPKLREKLSRISKPSHPKAPANIVIRTTLGLPYEAPVTNVDAIRTATAGILSHLRQGSDGSCFATPLAIDLLSSHLDRCVDDYATLLEYSKLRRTVNNNTSDFAFLLRMGNKNLDLPITLNREGIILNRGNRKRHLHEAPGIVAACRAIGIESSEEGVKMSLEKLLKRAPATQEFAKTTASAILSKLVQYAKDSNPTNKESKVYLEIKARFAFAAQESNPLLQVWGNAIAGMAEADESSMVKSAIISSVMYCLKIKIKEALPKQGSLRKELKHSLREALVETVHLQYDPIVPVGKIVPGQRSTEGAFVLYNKTDDPRPSKWFRVDNPAAFQEFVSRILSKIEVELENEEDEKKRTIVRGILHDLSEHIITDDFINTCLTKYCNENKKIKEPAAEYEDVMYAPWLTKCGNNFSKVLHVYLEESDNEGKDHFFPRNSKSLLTKIIEVGQNCPYEEKAAYKDNPHRLTPMRVPGVHAFSLMLGHPTLSTAWTQNGDTEAWIEEHVITPGKEIAKSRVDTQTPDALIKCLCHDFFKNRDANTFLDQAKSIPCNLSVSEYRSRMLKVLLSQNPAIDVPRAELPAKLDTRLYHCLPKKQKVLLEKSAVHFADTNWSDGIYDIHFCFATNPGNGELEIWGSRGNGKHMFALDQNLWLKNREWEIFDDF